MENIRLASASDLPRIAEIYHQNKGIIPLFMYLNTDPPLGEEGWLEWFNNHSVQKHPVYVLEKDNKIIGWTSLNKYSSYPVYQGVVTRSTYVCSSEQGKGYGLRLRAFAKEKAIELGYHTLISHVYEVNQRSIKLCEKEGMELWGKLPKVAFCGIKRWDMLIYGFCLQEPN